jgi:hypothetical protein
LESASCTVGFCVLEQCRRVQCKIMFGKERGKRREGKVAL